VVKSGFFTVSGFVLDKYFHVALEFRASAFDEIFHVLLNRL
jgi:hypothetical protein